MKNHIFFGGILGLSLLLSACTGGQLTPTTASVSVNGDANLRVGAPAQLSAVVKDAGGTALNRAVVWTSSDPEVVTIDASGNLNVKRLSVAPVTLSASADGKSGTLNVATYGLEVAGGTYAINASEVATALFAKFRGPNGEGLNADSIVAITGPSGSNTGGWGITLRKANTPTWSWRGIAGTPISGSYTAAATINGTAYTSTFAIDNTKLLPTFDSSTLTVTKTGYALSGTLPSGMVATQLNVYNDTSDFFFNRLTQADLPANRVFNTPLAAGTYSTGLYGFSYNPGDAFTKVTPAQFNLSFKSKGDLTVAP